MSVTIVGGGVAQLKIIVQKATNLHANDFGGTSDPYTQIQVGHDYGWNPTVWKTRIIKKTVNPIWMEEFIVPVASPEKDGIRFAVFDHELIGKDVLLGNVVYPNLFKLQMGVPTELVLELAKLHNSKGSLFVSVTAMNFGQQPQTVVVQQNVVQQNIVTPPPVMAAPVVAAPVATATYMTPPVAAVAVNPYPTAAPPLQNPYAAPPMQNPYGAPPPQNPYGAPPPHNPYGAPPPQNPYGAPPPQNPYGAPPPQGPYGGPPSY